MTRGVLYSSTSFVSREVSACATTPLADLSAAVLIARVDRRRRRLRRAIISQLRHRILIYSSMYDGSLAYGARWCAHPMQPPPYRFPVSLSSVFSGLEWYRLRDMCKLQTKDMP